MKKNKWNMIIDIIEDYKNINKIMKLKEKKI